MLVSPFRVVRTAGGLAGIGAVELGGVEDFDGGHVCLAGVRDGGVFRGPEVYGGLHGVRDAASVHNGRLGDHIESAAWRSVPARFIERSAPKPGRNQPHREARTTLGVAPTTLSSSRRFCTPRRCALGAGASFSSRIHD